jgi:O-antigen/teichoic acid export membrane protein
VITTADKIVVSHGSVYFLGNILRHAISFIMLPIYTRVLTPADYGTIELLSMVIDFSGIIFGLRIAEAIFRFYFDYDEQSKRDEVISTALILKFIINAIGISLLIAMSGSISTFIFDSGAQKKLLILFSLTLLFGPLIEIPMTYIRAQQKPWLYVAVSTLKMIIQLSLNIYLVAYLRLGVTGVIYSAVISSAIMAAGLSIYSFSHTGFRFSTKIAKSITSFSYPMMLAGMFSFYLTFGDRYFLNTYGTLSDVGIYSLGYKFGFLLTFIGTGPFFSVWDSERYNVMKNKNANATYQKVFIFFTGLSLLMVVILSLFSKNILMIMANQEFWSAYKIVPMILFAYFFQGWTGFCNFGILIKKKTFIVTQGTGIVAVVITGLYFLLIPKFGASGAAWATLIAFFLRFLYTHWRAKKLYDMELPWGKVVKLFPPCIAVIIISYLGPSDLVQSILLNVAVLLFLIYTATIISVFPLEQRRLLRTFLFKPWTIPNILRGFLKNA